jgi:hypothetical protein
MMETVASVIKSDVRRVFKRIKYHRHKATDVRSTGDITKDLFDVLARLVVPAPFMKAVVVSVTLTSCNGEIRSMRDCLNY